jgi:hypothetical protein
MALDVQRISGTYAKAAARLCNFATGEAFLLLAHQEYLDTEVRNVIRTMPTPWIDLFGYASRIGDTTFNLGLSTRRINAVKARIAEYANQVNFQTTVGYGETQSGPNERNNDGYYRAVEVYVYANKPAPPRPPTPKPILRRIVFRSFEKSEAKQDIPSPNPDVQKDAINDLLKLGLAAAQGKLTAEGLLGKEVSRRVSVFPSDFRVNKVFSNTERSFESYPGGSTTSESTELTYEWGPPMPFVIIQTRFQITLWETPRPAQNETKQVPRRQAESTPLIAPPDP